MTSALDTRTKGVSVVVYNPLNIERQDVVEANISFPGGIPKGVRVSGPDGKEVLSQLEANNGSTNVLFLANVPSVSHTVYDVEPLRTAVVVDRETAVGVTESGLENARYRIKLDQNGDLSSNFDKPLNRELLSAPLRLAFQTEKPQYWPAWNMDSTGQPS